MSLLDNPQEIDWLKYWNEHDDEWNKLGNVVGDLVRMEAQRAFEAGQEAERRKYDR